MFSIRFMLGVAAGFAGGYAVSRFIEAQAAGVPLDMAFKGSNILVPVGRLSIRQQEERARLIRSAGIQPSGPKSTTPLLLTSSNADLLTGEDDGE